MADIISQIKLPDNKVYDIKAETATTASKLGSSNVGSATQPIYLNGGTPTATTYTLGKSVPSNAEFTDTLPTAYCDTNAGTTAKVAKCTNFSLKNNSFIPINFKNGNTVTRGTGVTLNINNTGAKPVYVDFDDDSVPTDEPFDAGTYILYYTNQAYYLYTDGVLYPYRNVAQQSDLKYYSFGSQDGSVIITEGSSTSGGATTYTENFSVQKVNGHTVNSNVPSNAVFTDHKSTVLGHFDGMLVSETVDRIDFLNTDFTVSPEMTVQGVSFSTVSLLHSVGTDVPSNAVFTDTKNTAGSTDTSSKIFLIGATSQAANPQTYSDNEVYTTSGVLTTKSVQVGGGAVTLQYNSTTESLDFVFN